MIKKERIIIGLIILSLVIYNILDIVGKNRIAGKINKESMKSSNVSYNQGFTEGDSAIFRNSALGHMKNFFIETSNYRNNVTCHYFKKQARILYTRIDLKNEIPLDQLILIREKTTSQSDMHTYSVFDSDGYDLRIRGEKTLKKVDSLIFCLSGNPDKLQKTVFSKNFVAFYSPVSTFSLRYGEEYPVDIYFGADESFFGTKSTYPLIISFYRKGKSLYEILIIPEENNIIFDVHLLKEILKEN